MRGKELTVDSAPLSANQVHQPAHGNADSGSWAQASEDCDIFQLQSRQELDNRTQKLRESGSADQ